MTRTRQDGDMPAQSWERKQSAPGGWIRLDGEMACDLALRTTDVPTGNRDEMVEELGLHGRGQP